MISHKVLEISFNTLILILMTPFIILMLWYTIPYVDDFWFMKVMDQQGLLAFYQHAYEGLSFRYSAYFLIGLYYQCFALNGMGLANFILLCFGGCSLFFFIRTFLRQIISVHLSITLTLLFLCIWLLTGPAVGELHYWLQTHILYALPFYLLPWAVGAQILARTAKTRQRQAIYMTLSAILIIFIMGFSEIAACFTIATQCYMVLIAFFTKQRHWWWPVILLLLAFFLITLIIFAPGNQSRAQREQTRIEQKEHTTQIVKSTGKDIIRNTKKWSQSLPTGLALVIILLAIRPQSMITQVLNKYRYLVWIGMFIWISSYALSFLAGPLLIGQSLPGRALTPSYLWWISGLIGFSVLFRLMWSREENTSSIPSFHQHWQRLLCLIFLLSLIFSSRYILAWEDLVIKAPAYKATWIETQSKLNQARDSGQKTVTVKMLPDQRPVICIPGMLYVRDEEDPRNGAIAAYWKLERMYVVD